MSKTHGHHSVHRHSAVSAREVLLIALVAVLGGVGVYISTDTNTAFGLLSQPAYADFSPAPITFRTEALVSQPFLELNLVDRNKSTEQTSATDFDRSNPPAVTNLAALNTRVGGEVMVYWIFPDGVSTANVYRKEVATGTETQVATNVSTNYYQDENLENGTAYSYRVVSTVVNGTDTAESTATALTATVTPNDSIAPQPPSNITVSQIDENGGKGLRVEWTNPTEQDVDQVIVYRSEQFGTRGTQVATVPVTEPATIDDTEAPANTVVYYTVVAYDTAGNASSDDFQTPLPGNPSPFTPIADTQ